nr:MAG TPA: hypothetical protein [Inoviridae sp.]
MKRAVLIHKRHQLQGANSFSIFSIHTRQK